LILIFCSFDYLKINLKAFEFSQTGLAVPLVGATFAPLYRLNQKRFNRHFSRMKILMKPSLSNPHYLSIYYEQRWDQNIEDMREELGIKNLF
jgi:ubiquinone biosynthesis protein COQ4